MQGNDWMDETIPTERVRPPGEEPAVGGSASQRSSPLMVWVLVGLVLLVALIVCGLCALYLLRDQLVAPIPTSAPIILTPTAAPTVAITPTPVPTQISEPTPTISPDVAIGRYVKVVGTSGYGLSLRSGPGENYTRMDIALEGEVFIVVDGPTVAGDAEWWKIQDRENVAREWWAVGNFLEPVDQP